ncbi:MAG: hypothetical protein Q9161_007935 [Pseudevernia consocians]
MDIAEVRSGIWYNSEAFGGKVDLRSISFGFGRFANDGETAIFKVEDCAEEYMSEIMQRVSFCISTASIERPGQLVCFRGNVNDTDVPGLAVDKESREISFDWRAMFSRFCAEEKLKHYLYRKCLSDEGDGGIKEKVDRGEADRSETMSALIGITVGSFDESRTYARRARIRRQWEAEGQDCAFDEGFKEEEEAALGAVKEMQLSANYFAYSDEEVEEEAGSASRRKETTSEEEDEEDDEDDENAMYENLDVQDDVDNDDDDDDMEEEDDENVV